MSKAMAGSTRQNETRAVTGYPIGKDDRTELSSQPISLGKLETNGSYSISRKMEKIGPSKPYKNFYRHYHNYIVVIFIAVVMTIIVGSIIYVAIKRRKPKQRPHHPTEKRKITKGMSRHFSQSTLSNYESISSRRSNNRHARLTSQRSWADSPLSGIDSPFYDEILNKSLPDSLEAVGVRIPPMSFKKRQHEFSSGTISADTNSSSADLAKFYRQQGAFSPCYDVRSESSSPELISENKQKRIPLSELKSGVGIVFQISNMDLISTAVPRSPFAEKRKLKSLVFSTSLPTSGNETISQTPPLDSPSSEFTPLKTISEENPDGKKV